MSAESLPITAAAFSAALKDLTIPSLYAKVSELHNSIAHLEQSNIELRQFLEGEPDGDKDCEEAIVENDEVVKRMLERIDLVKAEVEARGQQWIELNGTVEPDELATEATATITDMGDVESSEESAAARGEVNDRSQTRRAGVESASGRPVENGVSEHRPTETARGATDGQRTTDPEEGVYL